MTDFAGFGDFLSSHTCPPGEWVRLVTIPHPCMHTQELPSACLPATLSAHFSLPLSSPLSSSSRAACPIRQEPPPPPQHTHTHRGQCALASASLSPLLLHTPPHPSYPLLPDRPHHLFSAPHTLMLTSHPHSLSHASPPHHLPLPFPACLTCSHLSPLIQIIINIYGVVEDRWRSGGGLDRGPGRSRKEKGDSW